MQMKKLDLENGIDNTNQKISMPLNDLKTILPNHRSPVGRNSGLSPLQVPVTMSIPPPNNAGSSFNSLGTQSANRSRYEASQTNKKYTSESLLNMLSGIYAKLLIVMGICFPIAEVMSKKIPTSYYEGFYLYLYGVSIGYLFFMYCFILRSEKQHKEVSCKEKFLLCFRSVNKHENSIEQSDDCSSSHHSSSRSINQSTKLNKLYESYEYTYCYLRLGVVAFGIASMIYSGLEFGQFFELQPGTSCYNVLFGISPIGRMSFTFIQMYFIFLNSQICIKRYKIVARFGLMHLIATNICIWLHVLVQETKHGILNLMNVNLTLPVAASIPLNVLAGVSNEVNFTNLIFEVPVNLSRVDRSLPDQIPPAILECRRSNIMGELVQEASHFLFPCTIQYSLICAAILYIMWKNIGKFGQIKLANDVMVNNTTFGTIQRQYNHVDCTKANKGLFTGILVLVLSIISIILFYVLISKPNYRGLAITEARVTELGLYLLTSVAVSVALIQVRELKYNSNKDTELDQILLIVAQSGLYLFTMFSIIGGHFTSDRNTMLVLLTSSACIIQATLQTIFILDASNCHASTADQLRRKPGRELVTFLLVCNFAMWAMNTLQTQRPDSNPIQLEFYGLWTWTVITHITTPLAIYFRFHSTVCLCAIWKKTYKLKSDFV